jgi:hypothetical protein
MFNCSPSVNNAIPQEYRKIAADLFPPEGCLPGKGPTIEAAIAFAELLGIGNDYKNLLSSSRTGTDIPICLGHFQNNLVLLIQKTWVEKADEARKEKLLDRLPDFIAHIERGDYQKALAEFGGILEELAWLFFGVQSRKEDFIEYALRIDTQMGLFWWYGGQIGSFKPGGGTVDSNGRGPQPGSEAASLLKALLLIGICYLTNF